MTPTHKHDKCGIWKEPDPIITPIDPSGDWTKGYIYDQPDPVLLNVSKEFPNAMDFFANLDQMELPFLDGYSI